MQACGEGFAGVEDDCVLIQLGSLHLKELSKARTAGDELPPAREASCRWGEIQQGCG